MKLKKIIKLIQTLADKHDQIASFHTGLSHEHEDSVIQYPALRLLMPCSVELLRAGGMLYFKFELTLFVNEIEEQLTTATHTSSKFINTNYLNENSTLTEDGDVTDENKLRDRALQLMLHITHALQLCAEESDDLVAIGVNRIHILERSNRDFVTGVQASIGVQCLNDYNCEYEDLYENVLNTL